MPLQKGLSCFISSGWQGTFSLEIARIQSEDHIRKHTALSGGIPSLEEDDDRQPAVAHIVLQHR